MGIFPERRIDRLSILWPDLSIGSAPLKEPGMFMFLRVSNRIHGPHHHRRCSGSRRRHGISQNNREMLCEFTGSGGWDGCRDCSALVVELSRAAMVIDLRVSNWFK